MQTLVTPEKKRKNQVEFALAASLFWSFAHVFRKMLLQMIKAFLLNVGMALVQDQPLVELGETPNKSSKDCFSFF